jgi:TolB-like protein/Tfp pilus assembly protein PilF
MYCLEDGVALVQGSVPSPDEPATAIFSSGDISRDHVTRSFEQYPSTDETSLNATQFTRSKKRSIVVGILGIGLVAALGLGGYLYYARGSTKQISSIAVMPFVNESGNADLEYLTDGMTDTLISSLSQVPNLSVKAHTSVFRYKGKETSPKTIASDLNVQAILNGRVISRGDQLTVALELIDPKTENVLWSENYDRKQGDIVSLEKEIATDVSTKLKSRLTGDDEQRVAKTYTTNAEAYQLYLKGRFYWNQRTAESLKKAADYFQQAIDKDPTYALAYSGLADSYAILPYFSGGSPQEYFPKAKAAALKAVQLDDNLAEAHASLGNILSGFEWNITDSTREFKRAIELNPNYATAHHWYSDGPLLSTPNFPESIAEMKRAQELDPMSSIISSELGQAYIYSGDYDAAIEQLRKAIQIDDTFFFAHWSLGWAYRMKGQYPQAMAEYQIALKLENDPNVLSFMGEAQAASGDRAAALKTLAELKERAKTEYVPAISLAQLCGALGEKDEAFQQLEDAYRNHALELQQIRVDPMLNSLRSDPRFDDLTKRVFQRVDRGSGEKRPVCH